MKKRGFNIKSQASMEFIILFGIVLIIFVVFMALTADRLKEATADRDIIAMKTMGDNIRNEVVLATQVKEFYIRRFKLPLTINGKAYKLELAGQDLKVSLNPETSEQKDYITFLPVNVGGSFFDKIEEEFLDYCIIKKPGLIKIARNQASINLESIEGTGVSGDIQASQEVSVQAGQTFTVTVNLDCIDEVEGVQFTIKYDNTKLNFDGKPMCDPGAISGKYECVNPNNLLAVCPAGNPDYLCYRQSAYVLNTYGYRPGNTFNSGFGMVDTGPPQVNAPAYTNLEASPPFDLTYLYDTPLFLNFKTDKEADCQNTQPATNGNPYQGKKCWDTSEGILTFGFIHRTGMKDTAQVAEIQFKAKSSDEMPSGTTLPPNTKIEFLSLTVPGFVEELGGVKRLPETRLPLNIMIS